MTVRKKIKLTAEKIAPSYHKRKSRWICGVDIGKQRDHTAITLNQIVPVKIDQYGDVFHALHIRHLDRLPLKMKYPDQVRAVGKLLRHPAITIAHQTNPELVIDVTGVGQAVGDMFEESGFNLCRITITGGDKANEDRDMHGALLGYNVPKRDIIHSILRMMQEETLKVAPNLPKMAALLHEFQNFKMKLSKKTGHDTYEAWREEDHDDIILSIGISCWYFLNAEVPQFVSANDDQDELEEGEIELPRSHTGYL